MQTFNKSKRFKFTISEMKFSDNCLHSILYFLTIEDFLDNKTRWVKNFDRQFLVEYANDIYNKYEQGKKYLPKTLPYFYTDLPTQLVLDLNEN